MTQPALAPVSAQWLSSPSIMVSLDCPTVLASRREVARVAPLGCEAGGVGIEYPELPGWEFTVNEVSAGQYRVRAVGPRGITGEAGAVDPDTAPDDLRRWARTVTTSPPEK